jgi:hypothetical protein
LLVGLALVILAWPLSSWLTGRGGDQEGSKQEEDKHVFPFANREKELKDITAIEEQASPIYYVVDAPAGYGKSEFLKELKTKFKQDGRVCARVQIRVGDGIDAVIKGLVEELKQELGLNRVLKNDVNRFDALAKKIRDHIGDKSLVLLFDFDKVLATNELDRLVTELLPVILKALKASLGARLNANRYRVIMAGRGIGRYLSSSQYNMQFSKLTLSTFKYADVRESTEENLSDILDSDAIDQLAAHTLYFTGGHPGCMAKTLIWFKNEGSSPDRFFEQNGGKVWTELVKLAVNDLLSEIDDSLQPYFYELSLFRRFDEGILREVIRDRFPDKVEETPTSLYQKITKTGLLGREYPARGDMVGRLLSIGLRNTDMAHYRALSQFVVELYHRLLCDSQEPNTGGKHTLFIEGLYQKVRHEYECYLDHRHNLRARFFAADGILNEYLRCLPKDSLDVRESLRSDLEDEDKSWEFRFCINYFLCNGCYDGSSYQSFLESVWQYFVV